MALTSDPCRAWLTRNYLQLLDEIEDEIKQGGNIIDWHCCDLFPKSWIDLVIVLRTDNTILYDRLAERYVSIVPLIRIES